MACGQEHARGGVSITIGKTTIVLCQECGAHTATAIQDKLSLGGNSVLTREEEARGDARTRAAGGAARERDHAK